MVDWKQFEKQWQHLKLNELLYLYSRLTFYPLPEDKVFKRAQPKKMWVDAHTNKNFIFVLTEDCFEITRNSDGEQVAYSLSF